MSHVVLRWKLIPKSVAETTLRNRLCDTSTCPQSVGEHSAGDEWYGGISLCTVKVNGRILHAPSPFEIAKLCIKTPFIVKCRNRYSVSRETIMYTDRTVAVQISIYK